jgi:hypothetical protein
MTPPSASGASSQTIVFTGCAVCGSNSTRLELSGKPRWTYKAEGFLCYKCYCRLYVSPKWIKILAVKQREHRIRFTPDGSRPFVKERIVRTGICQRCGKTGYTTQMHHTKYDPANPAANTIELCIRCHNQVHVRGWMVKAASKETTET